MAQEENQFKIVSKFKPTGRPATGYRAVDKWISKWRKISNITWCYW